jgi:pyruvate,water dikinase
VAVVIQKMTQSEISGIAFSVHPVTEDYNQMIIEAGFGLGEAIVSGSITPDAYVVDKTRISEQKSLPTGRQAATSKAIMDVNISKQTKGLFKKADGGNAWQDISEKEGKKQKLTKKQILELSDLIIKIEDHYQFPVDIEWAFENKKFYIVQSRPITTLID